MQPLIGFIPELPHTVFPKCLHFRTIQVFLFHFNFIDLHPSSHQLQPASLSLQRKAFPTVWCFYSGDVAVFRFSSSSLLPFWSFFSNAWFTNIMASQILHQIHINRGPQCHFTTVKVYLKVVLIMSFIWSDWKRIYPHFWGDLF